MKILRSSATVLTLLVVTAISAGASDAGSKIVASGNEQSWFDRMAAKIQLDKPNGILEINEQGWLAFIESKSKSLDSSKERLEKYKRPVGKNLLDGFDLIMRSRAASVKNARILFYYDPAAEYFLPLLTAEVKDLKQLMEHSYFGLKPDGGDLYSFSIPENAAEGAREIMNSVQVRYDGSTLICSHKDIIQAFDNDAVEASPLLKLHNKRLAVDQNVAFTFTVPGTLGELNGLNKRLAELITMQTEDRNAAGFVRMGIAMMTRHFAATLNDLVNISGSLDQDTDGKHKQQFVFEIKDGTPLKAFYAKLQGKEIDVFDWTAGFKQAIRDQRLKADVSIDDATISLQGTWDDNDHEFIQKQVLSPIAKWASSKEDPVPAPWAKDAVYESKPEFTELIDLSVLQKRLPELMKQAVYPLVYDGGKRLEFEIDPISAPLSGYSTDLIVDDVLDKEGRSLLRGTPRKLRFANSRPDGYRVNIMKPVEGKFGPPVKLKLTFKAKVFGETQITDFNIAEPIGTVKSDNENQYRLEVLKDDMVKVVHSGDAAFTIVAYDKTEKQLDRPTGIIHRNMGKFLGKVAGVKVLNRKPPVDCPFSVEIDLTDTSRQMPEEPSADVLTRVSRSSIDDYDGISDEQLESAKIEWQPRMKAVVMDLKGMRYSQRGETFYSAPQFFDEKGAFPVQTHTSSFSSELRCHISNRDSQERVAKANAIVGEFSFSVPSQVEWIELAVKPDSTESIIVLPNGEELVAVINKNHVKLQLKKVEEG